MSRLLQPEKDDELAPQCGAAALAIGDAVYENSAAKFWSSLIDEMIEDYDRCDGIELSAPGSSPLSYDLLRPQNTLERDFDSLMDLDLDTVIRDTIAEMTLLGGPAGVTLRLLSGDDEIASEQLPIEYIDSTVFAYLLAWLFEWSDIPEFNWNSEFIEGSIAASDYERMLRYNIFLEFRSKHLSEGLYQRSLSVKFGRSKFSRPTPGPGEDILL